MGVVLKESLLNEGFKHYKPVIKTLLILCVEKGPEYYINIIQRRKENEECFTLASGISGIDRAYQLFEDFDKVIALEGFGLSHTEGQNSSEEKDTTVENPGITPEELEKQRREEFVRDLVDEIDDSLE